MLRRWWWCGSCCWLLAAVSAGLIALPLQTNAYADRNLCGDMRVISLDNRRAQMPEIRENNNGVVTQITTVKVPADNQSEVLEQGPIPLSHDARAVRSGTNRSL